MVNLPANRLLGQTVEELLPNHRLRIGHRELSVSDAAVVASVVDVELGVGYRGPDDPDATSGDPIDPSSPRADWRSAYLTLQVEEVLGVATMDVPPTVKVGVTLAGGPIDGPRLLDSLADIGPAVFFIDDLPFGVDGDDSVHHLAVGGATTMSVDPEGNLSLPLYTAEVSQLLTPRRRDLPKSGPVPLDMTLEELRALAENPVTVTVAG